MEEYQFEKGRFVVPLSDVLPCSKGTVVKILKLQAIQGALREIHHPLKDTVRPGLLVSVF